MSYVETVLYPFLIDKEPSLYILDLECVSKYYGKTMSCIFNIIIEIFPVQVIHSARANATPNHGLDPDRLLVGNYNNITSFLLLFELWLTVLFLTCYS